MALNNVPSSRNEMIQFYKEHAPIWSAAAAVIGLTPAAATEVQALVDKAVASLDKANAARNSSKSSTAILNADAELLRSTGGAAVATIRAFAETSGDPAVYEAADLAPPSPPKPVGPPVAPTNLVADPTPNGTIEITWKGTTAQGQFFIIERSVDGGAWTRLQPVAAKKFTDLLVPRNSNVIQYQVWGARFDTKSATAPIATVNFGTVDPAIAAAFRSGAGGGASLAA